MSFRAVAAVLSAVVVGGIAAAGCSDGEGSQQDNTPKDVKTLTGEAAAAMRKFPAFKATMTGVGEDGAPSTADGCIRVSDKAVRMTTNIKGGTFDIIDIDGSQYMYGGVPAWATATGKKSPEAIAVLERLLAGGKWVRDTSDDDSLPFDKDTDGMTREPTTTFHGKHVIPLTKTDEEGVKNTYYIAAEGIPLLLGRSSSKLGTPLDRESVYEPTDACDVTVPPAALIIAVKDLDRELNALPN